MFKYLARSLFYCLTGLICCQVTTVNAQPENCSVNDSCVEETVSKDWQINIIPYFTLPFSTFGSARIGNREVNYHLNTGQLLDSLNFAISGRIEAWKGNFGLIFDGYYSNIQGSAFKEINRGPLDTTIESTLKYKQGIYDFALSYHIGDRPVIRQKNQDSQADFPRLWFTPIIGARLNSLNFEIDTTITFNNLGLEREIEATKRRSWFEPLIGGEIGIQISEPITLWARGDVSGFGLAGKEDLSWNAIFGLNWRVQRHISLEAAYRFYFIKYGGDSFEYRQNFNGPYLGINFNI